MKTVAVRNRTKGNVVAERAEVASNPWTRFRGLMGRRELAEGSGLLITPCSSIHMFFMRFPIDVVFLDRDDRVVKVVYAIRPWRLAMGGGGKNALELPAGAAERAGVEPGDELEVVEGG